MNQFVSRWLDYDGDPAEKPLPPQRQCDKNAESCIVPQDLTAPSSTVSPLPWQLNRLIAAAGSGLLPDDTVLESGLARDLNTYVLAWASSYLIGDPNEALQRLWRAHMAWKRGI